MDDERKVEEKTDETLHDQVLLFLGDELDQIHQDSSNNNYNIEEEYAKTKKNHSPYNIIVLLATFLVVIATVFFVNKYITAKDQEITVSLEEFEDLNLANLLNTVSLAQEKYDEAVKNLLVLETEYETRKNDIKNDLSNQYYILDSLNLSDKKEYNRRKNKLASEYKVQVTAIDEEYEEKLLLAKKEVDVYKARLDEFDTVKVNSAQEKEKLLNSERQLRQLEIDKLRTTYENRIANLETTIHSMKDESSSEIREAVHDVATRYQAEIDTLDPKIEDEKADTIIKSTSPVFDFDANSFLNKEIEYEEEVMASITKYQEFYNNYKYLDDIVRAIPQKNSIPDLTEAARNLVNSMSENYINSSLAYYKQILDDRDEIKGLHSFIEEKEIEHANELIKKDEEHALVLQNQEQAHATALNQNTAYYENTIKENNKKYEKFVVEKEKEAKNYIKTVEKDYASAMDSILQSQNIECVVATVNNSTIEVFLNPELKKDMTEQGLKAFVKGEFEVQEERVVEDKKKKKKKKDESVNEDEVKTVIETVVKKVTVKGNIVRRDNGKYYFEIEKDENGLIDTSVLSLFKPGILITVD